METTSDCTCSVCDKPLSGSAKKSRKLLYGSSATAAREILQYICKKETGKSLDLLISPATGPFLCRVCERQPLRVRSGTKSAEEDEKCILFAVMCVAILNIIEFISGRVQLVYIAVNLRPTTVAGVKTKLVYFSQPDPFR